PSTKGKVTRSLMQVSLPPWESGTELGPAKGDFAQWVAATKDKVRGKIVMIGKAAIPSVDLATPLRRLPDDRLKAEFDPLPPIAVVDRSGVSDQLERFPKLPSPRLT